MSDSEGDAVVSPGALPPVATEDTLADTLDAVVDAPADSVVSGGRTRSWLDGIKADTGLPKGDLTLTTLNNDPLNVGTTVEGHRKAQWGALLWKHAVASRYDDRIHGRGVHYVVVSSSVDVPSPNPVGPDNRSGTEWTIYRNTTNCYSYLAGALADARVLGYIPHSGIIDEKNESHRYRTSTGSHSFPSGGEVTGILGKTKSSPLSLPYPPSFSGRTNRNWGDSSSSDDTDPEESYREWLVSKMTGQLMSAVDVDVESEQPYHIEVWSEKSLPSEVRTAASSVGAGVVVEGEGCMSLTQAFEFGERVERIGKPAIVLYLSDFDPAGDDMPAQVANKFEWLKTNPRVDLTEEVFVDRLALTAEQVERHDLPRQPLDPDDYDDAYRARIEQFETEHGAGATELNALEADLDLYQRIVRDGIERYRDDDLYAKARDARGDFREACEDAVDDAIEESGVLDHIEGINGWVDDVDELVGEYEDDVDELHDGFKSDLSDLKDADAYDEFEKSHNSVGKLVDVPEFEVPDGTVSPPDDPLYDSAREYLTTVERVRARADGGARR